MEPIENLSLFFLENRSHLLWSGVIILFFSILRFIFARIIKKQARKNSISYDREIYMGKLFSLLMILVLLSLLGAIWEISLQGLSVYFASILTVLGVALFATWSVLSNLTASILLFFFFPYRIGQKVKIMDGDNSLEGIILDINLFYIKVETADGNEVAYPNNIAIQKPLIIKFQAKEDK
ncbi:MAG: mechanosensitive ion channel domain-containing protein [Bacteroidota bacterium]